MSWKGIRVTLSCAHMEIRARPRPGDDERWVIGATAGCWVCPARKRAGGGTVAAVRQIVNVEPVTAPRAAESLDPIHWFWEGAGH